MNPFLQSLTNQNNNGTSPGSLINQDPLNYHQSLLLKAGLVKSESGDIFPNGIKTENENDNKHYLKHNHNQSDIYDDIDNGGEDGDGDGDDDDGSEDGSDDDGELPPIN
jgi:hypothetical protein